MTDEEIEQRMRRTVAVIEATHTEQFYLWKEWSDESGWDDSHHPGHPQLRWEQMNPGSCLTLGYIEDMPVNISLTWNRIEGQVVLFWEMPSTVTDLRMGEDYLKKMLNPWPTYDKGYRRATFDAMNFGNAVSAIREAAGLK